MTKQYIITEAKRVSIENLLAEVGFDKRSLVKISNMLQSLPELTGEPVAYKLEVGEFRDLIHAHELPDHEIMMHRRWCSNTPIHITQPLQPKEQV